MGNMGIGGIGNMGMGEIGYRETRGINTMGS